MTGATLLVELLVEELPPKALERLGRAFADGIAAQIVAQGLAPAGATTRWYATPRRLAVQIGQVADRAADAPVTHRLMPASVGLDAAGQPTPALARKLAQLGLGADAASRVRMQGEGKAAVLVVDAVLPGTTLAAGLQKALDTSLAALPIPTVMQYQLADGWTSVKFVRPAHGLVALHGSEVVPCSVLGLDAGRATRGHRYDARVDPLVLAEADGYADRLRDDGAVVAGYAERRADILAQLHAAATAEGLTPIDDPALLDEVTGLVERPTVLRCRFDATFLGVPAECLILTMKANQKYFPLLDAAGRLTHTFLVVSNIRPADATAVVAGNERVVRPRLADAQFFYDQDRKRTLASRVADLRRVVYHHQLGSQLDRSERVERIVQGLCAAGDPTLGDACAQAARLAKADLTTAMVGEFPELQGVMGRYYALHDGVDTAVADAIEDHWHPRFAGDTLPRHRVGVLVALADKLESLVSLFGIGQAPTGDKDPYALRRQALGVVRLLVEARLPQSLEAVLGVAAAVSAPGRGDGVRAEVQAFVVDRAVGYFADLGIDARAVRAVLGPMREATVLAELAPIVHEAHRFIALPQGQVLAAANKRIKNILAKSGVVLPLGQSPDTLAVQPAPRLFREPQEAALLDALARDGASALRLREARDYVGSLEALVPLAEPVTAFFDAVMVNAEDPELRANRQALLQHAYAYMNLVADLSLMAA